jgi:hypothetical protein
MFSQTYTHCGENVEFKRAVYRVTIRLTVTGDLSLNQSTNTEYASLKLERSVWKQLHTSTSQVTLLDRSFEMWDQPLPGATADCVLHNPDIVGLGATFQRLLLTTEFGEGGCHLMKWEFVANIRLMHSFILCLLCSSKCK